MSWTPVILYVLSALAGGLLSWLLFGAHGIRIRQLEEESTTDKLTLQNLLNDFSAFKEQAKKELIQKDQEIKRLKKLSSAQLSKDIAFSDKSISEWKDKLSILESKSKSQIDEALAQNERLVTELDATYDVLDAKKKEIKKLKDKKKAFRSDNEQIKRLQKSLKKNKKKLKVLATAKASKPQKEKIEIIETLDIEKLAKLIESGSLTKKTRRKKASSKSDS